MTRNCPRRRELTVHESGSPSRVVGMLLLGLIIALSPGCSLLRAPQAMVTAVSSVGQSKPPDPLELQVQEQRFADDAMTQTAQALDEYARQVGTESARVEALRLKVVLGSTLVNTASGPNPNANLMDLVFGAWLTRKTIEDYWMLTPNGPAFKPWLETSRRLETNVWEIAASVLKPAQVNELREAIRQWYAQNPDVRFGFFIRPHDFASLMRTSQGQGTGGSSVFSLAGLDPMAGLDPAVREITRTRLFAERALFVLQRMPFLVRLQADLLAHEVVAQPEVQLALTNTTRLSDSMDRISRAADSVSQTAAQLPDRISAERKEILAALDQQEGKLRDLAAEVNRSLVSADKMSSSLTITITNFDALMKRFGVGEPGTNAAPATNSPPFNILDYGQVAQQVGAMATNLNTLLGSVNQNVPQIERLSQTATADAQKVVDHAYHLGLVLIAVLLAGLVVAGLVYRFFAEKLKSPGRPPSAPIL
jgi:hypothetical protein